MHAWACFQAGCVAGLRICSLLPPSWQAGTPRLPGSAPCLSLCRSCLCPTLPLFLHPSHVQELERNVLPLFELLRGWGLTQPELRKLTVAFPNLFLYRAETIEVGRVITPTHHGSAALRSPAANMTSLPGAACLPGACAG